MVSSASDQSRDWIAFDHEGRGVPFSGQDNRECWNLRDIEFAAGSRLMVSVASLGSVYVYEAQSRTRNGVTSQSVNNELEAYLSLDANVAKSFWEWNRGTVKVCLGETNRRTVRK